MRYLLGTGSLDGRPYQLLGGACNPTGGARIIHARIIPLPAAFGAAAGSVDDDGYGLHLRYSFDAEDIVPHTTYPGVPELAATNELAIDMGPGTHWLNHGGSVALVGGKGLWFVDIQVTRTTQLHPHWHWLTRRVPINVPFLLADRHNMIGSYNGTSVMVVNDGAFDLEMVVGSPPVPVVGGYIGAVKLTVTGSSDEALWIYSGWYG